MASTSAPSANEPSKDLILVHTVQLNPMINAHSSGRMISSGLRDVVIASVYSEKSRLKKLLMMRIMMMIIIMMMLNKSKEMMVLSGHQKLTSAMKVRLEK